MSRRRPRRISLPLPWTGSTTRRTCSGCNADRMLHELEDSDGARYWVCKVCWTYTPANIEAEQVER